MLNSILGKQKLKPTIVEEASKTTETNNQQTFKNNKNEQKIKIYNNGGSCNAHLRNAYSNHWPEKIWHQKLPKPNRTV